jgi:hypothetical protein
MEKQKQIQKALDSLLRAARETRLYVAKQRDASKRPKSSLRSRNHKAIHILDGTTEGEQHYRRYARISPRSCVIRMGSVFVAPGRRPCKRSLGRTSLRSSRRSSMSWIRTRMTRWLGRSSLGI